MIAQSFAISLKCAVIKLISELSVLAKGGNYITKFLFLL